MELASSNTKKNRKIGRPMAVGRVVCTDRIPGGIGAFAGPCPSCNDKVILSVGEAEAFAKQYYRDKRSYFVRALKHLQALRSI